MVSTRLIYFCFYYFNIHGINKLCWCWGYVISLLCHSFRGVNSGPGWASQEPPGTQHPAQVKHSPGFPISLLEPQSASPAGARALPGEAVCLKTGTERFVVDGVFLAARFFFFLPQPSNKNGNLSAKENSDISLLQWPVWAVAERFCGHLHSRVSCSRARLVAETKCFSSREL